MSVNQSMLASAVQSIDDAVVTADERGLVTFINRQAEETIGIGSRDAVGARLESVFRVDLSFEIASDVRVTLTKPDGASILIEHSAAPIVDDDGVARGTVITFRDISEKLRRDEDRALTERLTTVATIAAGICHELNNPVASIQSNLEFVGHELDAVAARSPKLGAVLSDAREALADGFVGVERVKDIVKQMRVFLFADAGPTIVDVNRALNLALRLLAVEINMTAALECTLGEVPGVLCAEGQLAQAFMNILRNATQAMRSGQTGNIRVRTFAEAPWAVVEIVDDGAGIGAADLTRVFEPFFTTREPGHGTGLGLSISRAIVLRAGGTITATSAPHAGTTLRIQLPLAAQ